MSLKAPIAVLFLYEVFCLFASVSIYVVFRVFRQRRIPPLAEEISIRYPPHAVILLDLLRNYFSTAILKLWLQLVKKSLQDTPILFAFFDFVSLIILRFRDENNYAADLLFKSKSKIPERFLNFNNSLIAQTAHSVANLLLRSRYEIPNSRKSGLGYCVECAIRKF